VRPTVLNLGFSDITHFTLHDISHVYCQLCSLKFDDLTPRERQAHYDQKHNIDDPKSNGHKRATRRPPASPAPRAPSSSFSKLKGKYKEMKSETNTSTQDGAQVLAHPWGHPSSSSML